MTQYWNKSSFWLIIGLVVLLLGAVVLIINQLDQLVNTPVSQQDIHPFVDPDIMTAAVQVPEQLHSRVAVGDAVKVRIDSLGDRSFDAKILRIHPVVDAQTRQGTVEIRLNPVPGSARPGQLCRVTLETAETPRLLIPLSALQFDGRGSFVYFLSEDSKAMHRPVTIGLQIGESIEIIDGVDDGDQIVSRGFLGLKSGKTVRVVEPVDQESPVTAGISVTQDN